MIDDEETTDGLLPFGAPEEAEERTGTSASPAAATPEAGPGSDPGAGGEPAAAGEAAPEASVGLVLSRAVPGCLLAWAVPGLGHVVLGRVLRGIAFGVVVLGLFAGGIAMDGKVYKPVPGEPLSYLAAVGAAGVGVPFAVAHLGGMAAGRVTSPYHDYGTTFTLVAGLLNLLVVIDAYDVAMRRR